MEFEEEMERRAIVGKKHKLIKGSQVVEARGVIKDEVTATSMDLFQVQDGEGTISLGGAAGIAKLKKENPEGSTRQKERRHLKDDVERSETTHRGRRGSETCVAQQQPSSSSCPARTCLECSQQEARQQVAPVTAERRTSTVWNRMIPRSRGCWR